MTHPGAESAVVIGAGVLGGFPAALVVVMALAADVLLEPSQELRIVVGSHGARSLRTVEGRALLRGPHRRLAPPRSSAALTRLTMIHAIGPMGVITAIRATHNSLGIRAGIDSSGVRAQSSRE